MHPLFQKDSAHPQGPAPELHEIARCSGGASPELPRDAPDGWHLPPDSPRSKPMSP